MKKSELKALINEVLMEDQNTDWRTNQSVITPFYEFILSILTEEAGFSEKNAKRIAEDIIKKVRNGKASVVGTKSLEFTDSLIASMDAEKHFKDRGYV